MTIHVFNPDHDIALASNQSNYTTPRVGRELHRDLGYIPMLWAKRGDVVVVDDVEQAEQDYSVLGVPQHVAAQFVTLGQLPQTFKGKHTIEVAPWGWNTAIRNTLLEAGVPETSMPDIRQLETIRELSSRRLAVRMLDSFKDRDGLTGFSRPCDSFEEVMSFLIHNKDIVIKAPWSSSGRGVRYTKEGEAEHDESLIRWIHNVIDRQGFVVAEERCDKEMDFAVEFTALPDGKVQCCGLSLFSTKGSAYTGNLLLTEREKENIIDRYIPINRLNRIIIESERFLGEHIAGQYVGPLGVDMMIVRGDEEGSYMLNPCVEINMRRTMGHVALALTKKGKRGMMCIDSHDGHFDLHVSDVES